MNRIVFEAVTLQFGDMSRQYEPDNTVYTELGDVFKLLLRSLFE